MKSIERLTEEITKTKAKISDLQTRLRDLERQKTELENAEIVALVRGVAATPKELGKLLQSLHGNQDKEESENEG